MREEDVSQHCVGRSRLGESGLDQGKSGQILAVLGVIAYGAQVTPAQGKTLSAHESAHWVVLVQNRCAVNRHLNVPSYIAIYKTGCNFFYSFLLRELAHVFRRALSLITDNFGCF